MFEGSKPGTLSQLQCKGVNVSCKRVQDPRAVFGKRLPGLHVDGTSPSRRSLTFQLEPNMKIIKVLMDIAARPAGFQRLWLAFLLTLPSHKSAHTPVLWCEGDTRNGAGISHGQASGKMLQNTSFQEACSSGTTGISPLLAQANTTAKRHFPGQRTTSGHILTSLSLSSKKAINSIDLEETHSTRCILLLTTKCFSLCFHPGLGP